MTMQIVVCCAHTLRPIVIENHSVFKSELVNDIVEKGLVTKKESKKRGKVPEGSNRMPADSAFYDKILPILLISLAALTVILILAAAGILLGIIPFN